MLQPRLSFLIGCLVYTVAMRLLPYVLSHIGLNIDPGTTVYPWNFSPLPAVCLFGAAFYADRRLSFAIPLAVMLLGDVGIGAVSGRLDWAFYPDQPFVYACIVLTVLLGFVLRTHRSVWAIGGIGLGSAVVFYVVTNFGVWLCGDGVRYPHTLTGLLDCYVQAIPFFRNYVVGTLLFSALLFSRVALVHRPISRVEASGLTMARS